MKRVLIGIQARSTSKRFPRKVFERIGDKPMLLHVLDACDASIRYMNKRSIVEGREVSKAVLVPTGDKDVIEAFKNHTQVLEGPEDDVLERYTIASRAMRADYVVRITSDCPLITPDLISKMIRVALKNQYDYFQNVDETCRTFPDGFDVEVLTAQALEWLCSTVSDSREREHVTLAFRTKPLPQWFRQGFAMSKMNFGAEEKLSVDTTEDAQRVAAAYEKNVKRHMAALSRYGAGNVHFI